MALVCLNMSGNQNGESGQELSVTEIERRNALIIILQPIVSTPNKLTCPNPNCSKKKDALPKVRQQSGLVYAAIHSYRASCPTCGDERDIRVYE